MAKNKAERQEEENKIQHTTIEWVKNPDGSQGYTVNPVKGKCPVACPYCYARRLYDRFKWNSEIRFDPTLWIELRRISKPSRIFVGSTMELFGDWIKPTWMEWIWQTVREFPQHTFIFLTKQPQNLIKWSPFPGNCWVGVTVCNADMFLPATDALDTIEATTKYISFEPLLENPAEFCEQWSEDLNATIDWLIIGQQTPVSAKTEPKIEWIKEIVEAADRAGIPVFLKDNLKPLFGNINEGRKLVAEWGFTGCRKLRQELPGD